MNFTSSKLENHYVGFALCLWLLISPLSAFTQENYKSKCLSGDCKNGTGVLQTGEHSYEAGQFNKGVLNGEGTRITFRTTGSHFDVGENEKRFLADVMQQSKRAIDPQQYQPFTAYTGNFIKGKLQGTGKSIVNEKREVVSGTYKNVIDHQLLPNNIPFTTYYEGAYIDNEPLLSGALRIENNLMTLEYPAGQMERILADESGMYIITVKQTGEKGYYNGMVKSGYKNGWFITNISKLDFVFENGAYKIYMKTDSGFFRSLYLEDELIGNVQKGVYPLDEASSLQVTLPDGRIYYGPLNENKQPNGFGMISYQSKDNKGNMQKRYSYIGYFNNGKKEGLGEWRTYYNNEISSHHSGQYRQDTLRNGFVIYHGATVWKNDPQRKKEKIIDYTEYSYVKGDIRPVKQLGGPDINFLDGYGETGRFKKFHHTGNNINIEKYVGFVNNEMKYHGQGKYTNLSTGLAQEGQFANGKLRAGASTFKADGLAEGWVVENNGKKVYVASVVYPGGQRILSDGSVASGEYKVLGFKGDGFRCACPGCNGTGESNSKINVPVTEHSWTRDVQTIKAVPYLNAQWQGITKVTTGYTTGGYSYNQKQMCKSCNGKGYYYCKSTLP